MDCTVVVLTYNSNLEKTLYTIKSAMMQKNVEIEIIVADDASEQNNFNEIRDYFEKWDFKNFKLLPSEENQGTVSNLFRAVKAASGKYIKDISPGDYFYSEQSCANAISELKKQNAQMGFGLCVGYSGCSKAYRLIDCVQPFNLAKYENQEANARSIQKDMFLLDDCILGAGLIGSREYYLFCLERFIGKVKLFEDKALTFFTVVNRSKIAVILEPFVWYEVGSGITTNQSRIKSNRLQFDEDDANIRRILLSETKSNPIIEKAIKRERLPYVAKKLLAYYRLICFKSRKMRNRSKFKIDADANELIKIESSL